MRMYLVLVLVVLSTCGSVTWAQQDGAVTEVKTETEVKEPSKNDDEDDGVSISIADDEKINGMNGDDVFIPTKEWQTVKPGQTIPKGLHVRMNIQTGVREAKLMDGDDGSKYQKVVLTKNPDGTASQKIDVTTDPDSSSSTDDGAGTSTDTAGTAEEKGRLVRMKEALEDAMRELEEGKQPEPESESQKEESLKYWKQGDKQGMLNKNKKHFTHKELKDALKKFKANRDDVSDEQRIAESAKKKYRKIEDLKKDFEKMNMNIRTDMEIMQELMKRYNRAGISAAEKKNILTDFEYYVHQIDNAQDFADMGGLVAVIKDLNHTDEVVRSEAAFVLGSAMQSNPKVQVTGVEGGAVQVLIRMLSTEPSVKVRNRVMYALSSLIRHFPYAQQRFLQLGGLQALSNLFSQAGTEKIRVKAVTLIHDLLTERTLTEKHSDPKDTAQQEKIRQYKRVPLLSGVIEQGWCDLIPTLLSMPEHDTREKVLSAMDSLVDSCRPNFIKAQLSLSQLKTEYEKLSQQEKQDDGEDVYFGGLLKIVENMITKLKTKDEL